MSETEMPRYVGLETGPRPKKVHALKIAAVRVHEDGSAAIDPADEGFDVFRSAAGWAERFHGDEDDQGYYVVYVDGYASWSPSKAFEDGYMRT